jgi:hypothetical protein
VFDKLNPNFASEEDSTTYLLLFLMHALSLTSCWALFSGYGYDNTEPSYGIMVAFAVFAIIVKSIYLYRDNFFKQGKENWASKLTKLMFVIFALLHILMIRFSGAS